jgi:ATP dependent DNA ligase domain
MADEIADTAELGAGVAHRALGELRIQEFGDGSPAGIANPIVEPLWVGVRALAAVSGRDVAMRDLDGDPVGGFDDIAEALAIAAQSDEIVVEGYITKQATHEAPPVVAWSDEMPSLGTFVGLRRNRALDATRLKEETLAASMFDEDDVIAFVATDLLWLDETSLLDVPLLERRRWLESVVQESDGVRLGAFVRPPIDPWVGSWRAQGFTGLTYKAANSHYLPGKKNPDWAIGGMPRR